MEKTVRRQKGRKLGYKENIAGLLFVAPPFLALIVFTLVPIVMSLYLSFTQWSGFNSMANAEWVGWRNFYDILGGIYSKDFYNSIFNTVFLMLSIPFTLILALLLAIALNKKIRFSEGFRVIYYIPAITSVVAVTIIFDQLFNNRGIINSVFNTFGLPSLEWKYNPALAKVIIIILSIWKGLGYTMLLYLAGLQGISKEYYEAAALDGASSIKQFLKITVPLIHPMTFYLVITNVIGGLQSFTESMILFPWNAGMGPEKGTMTMMVMLYYHFGSVNNMGIASAIAWVLAVIIFIVTALQFIINQRRNKEA